jgi:hypothetical protein
MSLKNFSQFNLTEIFNFKLNENKSTSIDDCVNVVVSFLKDNQIDTWTEFIETSKFDKFVISKIIDSYCDNLDELNEVRFKLRLKLCDVSQLKDMLKEYEQLEEFEKCQVIKSQIENKKNLSN